MTTTRRFPSNNPGDQFSRPLDRNFKGVRVAMFKDLGLPWEPEVKAAVQAQRKVFESLGCIVIDAEPDFRDANESFLMWRHWSTELAFGDQIAAHGDQMNEYIHWHVEEGRKLTGPQLSRIEAKRSALFQRMTNFKGEYDFFIMPVNQVLPFDVTQHYPTEIAGVKMENYLAWMKSAYYVSAAGNPAMSVPCAFSSSGLPIGDSDRRTTPRRLGSAAIGICVRAGYRDRQAASTGCLRNAILFARNEIEMASSAGLFHAAAFSWR